MADSGLVLWVDVGTRTGLLDQRFDYLPHGMMKRLEAMLADGHITKWERDHFEDALRKETLLGADQKAKVWTLIEEWFARDAAAGKGHG